jgi:hypothetical protein
MTFSSFLKEIAHYLFNIADNRGSLHETPDRLVNKGILSRANQLYAVGPLTKQLPYKSHCGSLFAAG